MIGVGIVSGGRQLRMKARPRKVHRARADHDGSQRRRVVATGK
jgi:hypothetical protein